MATVIPVSYLCDQKYDDLMADTTYNKANLFEDQCFKSSDESIFLGKDTWLSTLYEKRQEIKWLRPKEILGNQQEPLFFKDGASFNEVMLPEGDDNLVNASFMNALAGITLAPSVLKFVCPEQSFKDNYKGIFRFRFWRFGKWSEVVIDDRLPTLNGKLVFSRALSKDEFWVSLMEKALAKLLMRYEAMDCSFTEREALLDLSGGTVETVTLSDLTEATLRSKLKMYKKTGSLVTAFAARDKKDCLNRDAMYLISGSVQKVMYDNNGIMCSASLIRILNTYRCEWTGPWGDKSKEMQSLSKEIREEFEITSQIDGDFWMDLKDFLKQFQELRILHIPPELSVKEKKWNVTEHYNKWQKGTTAIGCLQNNKEDFHKNPQYNITVEGDGDLVIASLMLVGKRREETTWQSTMLGIDVFKCEAGATIDSKFIHNNEPLHTIKHSQHLREMTLFMALDPGNYVIIPSTFKRNVELPFLLRIFGGFSSKTASANCISSYRSYRIPEECTLNSTKKMIIECFIDEHAGEDGLMDNCELDAFFVTLKDNDIIPTAISQETSAAIAALFDDDDSRKLSRDEALRMAAVSNYCNIKFRKADEDKNGSLDASELRNALIQSDIYPSDTVLYHLVGRYVGSDNKITFDEFLLMLSKIRYLIRKFEARGGSNSKPVALSFEDILEICVKL